MNISDKWGREVETVPSATWTLLVDLETNRMPGSWVTYPVAQVQRVAMRCTLPTCQASSPPLLGTADHQNFLALCWAARLDQVFLPSFLRTSLLGCGWVPLLLLGGCPARGQPSRDRTAGQQGGWQSPLLAHFPEVAQSPQSPLSVPLLLPRHAAGKGGDVTHGAKGRSQQVVCKLAGGLTSTGPGRAVSRPF